MPALCVTGLKEPYYEAFVELLSDLYDKHIHDQSERRFVVECDGETRRAGRTGGN